jgi:2C-methyl-D-erythritol 2,4-cyclodiphosphate synthase
MYLKKLLYGSPWYPVFDEGDDAGAGGGTDDGAGGEGGSDDAAAAAKAVADAEAAAAAAENSGKLFTQKEVNEIMAKNKRALQTKNETLINDLEKLKKSTNMTAEQRAGLETRIEALQDELLTKSELSKKEQAKLRTQHDKEIAQLTGERDNWQTRYTSETITRSITDASATNKAINPSQIVAILKPKTILKDEVDNDGEPTGRLIPRVKLEITDKDGKPTILDVTVPEAVKQMKDMEDYFNLFQGEGTGGLGSRTKPGGKAANLQTLATDAARYREARKSGKV